MSVSVFNRNGIHITLVEGGSQVEVRLAIGFFTTVLIKTGRIPAAYMNDLIDLGAEASK